jgi:hypothetical protein
LKKAFIVAAWSNRAIIERTVPAASPRSPPDVGSASITICPPDLWRATS